LPTKHFGLEEEGDEGEGARICVNPESAELTRLCNEENENDGKRRKSIAMEPLSASADRIQRERERKGRPHIPQAKWRGIKTSELLLSPLSSLSTT